MRYGYRKLGCFASLILTCLSVGCSDRAAPVTAGVEAAAISHEQALGLSDRLTAIYRRGDWPALAALLASDYLGTTPGAQWDGEVLEREFAKIRMTDYQRENFLVKQLAPDLVLLNEDATLKETYDGEDISGRYRMTTIWINRANEWRLLFEQEVPLPEEN